MNGAPKSTLTFDWRWIAAGYCYLVLFHLFPTYLLGGISLATILPHSFAVANEGFDSSSVMMVWMLGGIAVVAFIVAFRSTGTTILEPAFAGVLYAITLTLAFRELASPLVRDRHTLAAIFWLLIVVILAVVSAWLGEAAQGWKMKRAAKG